jgi:hypothetical protein
VQRQVYLFGIEALGMRSHNLSDWDFSMPVNQCSRLVQAFPNKLPDYLLAAKEHGRCTDGHAVSA